MDVALSCRCCLRRAPDKDLTTPYIHLGNTEIYSEMLKECFEIHLILNSDDEVGICEVCVGRLRDASDFKLQVQRSHAELQARLQGTWQIKDEEPPVKLEVDEREIMLHEEYIIKSELEEQHGPSEIEMLYEEPAVKSEVWGDAASDDECATLIGAEPARPVFDVSCVKLERLRGDEAPRASQTCLATSRHGPRRATRVKDLPDDTEEQACTCDTCGEHLTDKASLIKHIQAHSKPADKSRVTYSCKTCSQEFSCMNIYTNHVKTHMDNRTDTYMYDAKFSTQSFLNSHVGTHKDGKRYPCEVCNKTFVNNSALTKHKKIHTGKKTFTCDECNKQYQSKGNFIAHVRVHTGVKPYSCKECNKQFTHKQHLECHTIIHTGVKPYSCEVCNKQFTQKGNLNRHSKIHSGEKPYGCEECGKHFAQKHYLDDHKRIHTGEKPYSCEECNKQFTHKFSIIRHKKVHTREKNIIVVNNAISNIHKNRI